MSKFTFFELVNSNVLDSKSVNQTSRSVLQLLSAIFCGFTAPTLNTKVAPLYPVDEFRVRKLELLRGVHVLHGHRAALVLLQANDDGVATSYRRRLRHLT